MFATGGKQKIIQYFETEKNLKIQNEILKDFYQIKTCGEVM